MLFLFTIVDGIFIGRGVGIDALGAVNLAFPFVMVVMALFMLINIGSVAIFAIQLGKGNIENANKVFRHGLILLVGVSVLLSVVGVFGAEQLSTLLGANETFHQHCVDYLFWYSLFIIPNGLFMGLQAFCRNDDAPGLVSVAVIASTAFNVFSDWFLIFPVQWGVKGAAIATGLSQVVGLLVMLTHFIRKNGILRFGMVKFEGKIARDIVVHGLPEAIGQLATPVMTFCMNIVLINMIGDIGVNAFSVISYVASFTLAVFFGASEGLQPLFGQSYGAKNQVDLKYYLKTGLVISFIGGILISGLILVFSRPICTFFGADAQTLEYVLKVMPQFSLGFIVMAFNVMFSSYLYSTERSAQAIILNVLRSIVVSAAVILLIPAILGANMIWYTFAIYEAIVLVVAVFLVKHSERNGIVFK